MMSLARALWSGLFLGSFVSLCVLVPLVHAQDLTTELAFFLRDLRNMQSATTVTVDAATTFAASGTYQARVTLACTGAEAIDTITGGVAGMRLIIHHTDADCTLNDDETPTAANAIDLTGAANDVGAAKKNMVLLFDGTSWEELSESDN